MNKIIFLKEKSPTMVFMMKILVHRLRNWFVVAVLLILPSAVYAGEDIRVGMTGALSGSNAKLGQQMKLGLELAFSEINTTDGINGRHIKLITLDDAYRPLEAAKNMRQLINEENVLAILGNTGTPTAVLTAPIAKNNKILMLGAYTGADILRGENAGCCIYNYRASYKQEINVIIDHILSEGIAPEKISFFTQDDAFGLAGYNCAIEKLEETGFETPRKLVRSSYRRNTVNVERAVADMLMADVEPKAIIMVSSYKASSVFIKLLKQEVPDIRFYNISFTGSAPLLESLGADAEGVYITEVVPHFNKQVAIAKSYKAALESSGAKSSNVVSFEGYIIGKIFIEVLESINGDIDKDAILLAISKTKSLALKTGLSLKPFLDGERQASNAVWLNRVEQGVFKEQEIGKW